ncbi:MAG: TetR/AcrR family transcriptional regulator [Myxococcota bacterium]|nr:TetR/AcrR family transcriptional regulator [Myxococcota bacterium]
MTFKEQEEERRRSYILEVAERLIARGGFHETSVGDIAKEAGFGVGTLYKYFKDKDDLFKALLELRIEENFRTVHDAIDQGGSPLEVIGRVIDMFIDKFLQRSDYMMLYLNYIHPRADSEHQCGKGDLSWIRDRKAEQFARLETVFEQGIEEGLFANVPAHYLAGALHGVLISMFFTTHFRLGGRWDPQEVKRVVRQIFFDPILKGSVASPTGVEQADEAKKTEDVTLPGNKPCPA